MKKWILLNSSKIRNYEEIIKVILENRGIKTKKEIEDFLSPKLSDLTYANAGLKKGELDKAVARIKRAIEDKEQIIVYTDYDVDGVASGAIVWEALFAMGAKVLPYVPHRIEEGYGLSEKGIDKVYKENNAKLIVTVDHGVTAAKKVEYAKKLGIDTIIIDHHVLPQELSPAVSLVHTTGICAAGVAWFFVNYLFKEVEPLKRFNLTETVHNLDLVALATIADLIPLTGINRILVKFGLVQLNKTKREGLLALIKSAGLKSGDLGVYEVGHILAPRINASGRLTHALDSLRLLCTKDPVRADLLAQNLSQTNRERQLILEETVIHATESARLKAENEKLIFISHETYNQGVIGLVAGKLTEEYYLPTVVISKGGKYSKASARSIPGFNIVRALRSFSDILVDVGGHPMAAGFTMETAKLSLLEEKLLKLAQKEITSEKLQRVLKIDCELDLRNVDLKLFDKVEELSPFGAGNPQPIFMSKEVKVVKVGLVGKEKQHLKLTLQPDIKYNEYIGAIGFGMGEFYEKIDFQIPIDIVFAIDKDDWNDDHRLQLKLRDVKIATS